MQAFKGQLSLEWEYPLTGARGTVSSTHTAVQHQTLMLWILRTAAIMPRGIPYHIPDSTAGCGVPIDTEFGDGER